MNKKSKISYFITNSRRVISCYQYNFLELLAVKTRFFNALLTKARKPVFLNEIKMSGIKKDDNVLLIGCGIFPLETMLIAQETNAKVVGIDNSDKAVKIAKKYIKKIGLEDDVKIEYADGRDVPVKEFDVVFIAINVFPIENVLLNISKAKDLKKNTRILCKSIKHDIPDILEKTGLNKFLSIKSMVKNPRTQSYLLVKN